MNMAAKVTASYFESKELSCEIVGEEQSAIRVGMGLTNLPGIVVLLAFGENNNDVQLATTGFCKFDEDKKPAMYKVCSELNSMYRWEKFYVEEDYNTICVEDDGYISLDNCGEECYVLLGQLCHIVDEAYKTIMKALVD